MIKVVFRTFISSNAAKIGQTAGAKIGQTAQKLLFMTKKSSAEGENLEEQAEREAGHRRRRLSAGRRRRRVLEKIKFKFFHQIPNIFLSILLSYCEFYKKMFLKSIFFNLLGQQLQRMKLAL